jgi:hypothetical protein
MSAESLEKEFGLAIIDAMQDPAANGFYPVLLEPRGDDRLVRTTPLSCLAATDPQPGVTLEGDLVALGRREGPGFMQPEAHSDNTTNINLRATEQSCRQCIGARCDKVSYSPCRLPY